MSVPPCTVLLAPQHRRQLAAVLLRGNLRHYDVSASLAHVIDSIIDDLLSTTTSLAPGLSWDILAQHLIARFSYRLPTSEAQMKAA